MAHNISPWHTILDIDQVVDTQIETVWPTFPHKLQEVWSLGDNFHDALIMGKDRLVWFQTENQQCQHMPPREWDRWITEAVDGVIFSWQECEIINKLCQHQQVLFELDIFCMDGMITLDGIYSRVKMPRESCSKWTFPAQRPTPSHMHRWAQALRQLAWGGWQICQLGQWMDQGHKVWEWAYNEQHG
jgi:hypothetical protein